jgi:Icc-related predicted phosphoesterase
VLRRSKQSRTRLFFATDVHGSEQCFRKWVNAAQVYEVSALILGGDVTGKVLVPLVANGDGVWRGELYGEPVAARGEDELAALRKRIRTIGRYDVVLTPQEKGELDADPARVDTVFHEAMRESLERWVALAEERLGPAGIPCYMMLGNDDFDDLAETLRGSEVVTYAEDGIYDLPGGFELASIGYSTPTPWHTPRELSEVDLGARIDTLLRKVREPEQAVFNFHCPPRDTHLDQAPMLDDQLRPVVDASGVRIGSVGSAAVRRAIEDARPLLGLHGHVHESPAGQKLGPATCINPGSDYGDGVLRGAIVDLDRDHGVRRWQIVQG